MTKSKQSHRSSSSFQNGGKPNLHRSRSKVPPSSHHPLIWPPPLILASHHATPQPFQLTAKGARKIVNPVTVNALNKAMNVASRGGLIGPPQLHPQYISGTPECIYDCKCCSCCYCYCETENNKDGAGYANNIRCRNCRNGKDNRHNGGSTGGSSCCNNNHVPCISRSRTPSNKKHAESEIGCSRPVADNYCRSKRSRSKEHCAKIRESCADISRLLIDGSNQVKICLVSYLNCPKFAGHFSHYIQIDGIYCFTLTAPVYCFG